MTGGLDLGLERAGLTCRWQVEIDDYARRVLAKHWPDVPRHGDIRGLTGEELEPVDLICGGFPCQPVSVAGRRKAQADDRWLWPDFARLVGVVRPRYVLVENVLGLLRRGMGDVLRDLSALGFDAEWESLPAAAFGAPHIRERVFIVAHARSERWQRRARLDGDGRAAAERFQEGDHAGFGSQALADTSGDGRQQGWPGAGQGLRQPGCRSHPLADPHPERRSGWAGIFGTERGAKPSHSSQWDIEPDVGRVVARFSAELDGGLGGHQICVETARAKGVPQTQRLLTLREHIRAAPSPSGPAGRCAFCGHPLSSLPCRGACSPWRLGQGTEAGEELRCLREGVLGLLAQQGQDVQPYLSLGNGQSQCGEAVERSGDNQDLPLVRGRVHLHTSAPDDMQPSLRKQARMEPPSSRVARLRGLGNAVVPQVAEWLGRRIVEAAS